MQTQSSTDRRGFLVAGIGGAALVLAGCGSSGSASQLKGDSDAKSKEKEEGGEDVSPGEDLMREHGVLNRALLVYEECARRIESRLDLPPEPLAETARLIRTFIEDYHEKIEENHLFPRFRAAGKLMTLVDTLTEQHQAGRVVTARIESLATFQSLRDPEDSQSLLRGIRQFIRMYRPHEAREDTVLFPVLHQIVSRNEYDAMGEEFERIEHRQLGAEGFERAVERIAEIESRLGIVELGQFTPHPV